MIKQLKQFMSKITDGTIKVLTVAGYVALGIVIAAILVYLLSDLTIADQSEVDHYNQIKDKAINEMLDSTQGK